MTKLEDLRLNGIAADTTEAEKNFIIFQKIIAIWDEINEFEREDHNLLIYIRDCAIVKTVLHLGRLYDRKSSTYETRCLEEIIDFIQQNKIPTTRYIFPDNKWNNFIVKHSIVFNEFNSNIELKPENFIQNLNDLLFRLKKNDDKTVVNTLKYWRDKGLAHNERIEDKLSLEIDEINLLIQIPKSLLDFINDFMNTGTYFVYEANIHTYFCNLP